MEENWEKLEEAFKKLNAGLKAPDEKDQKTYLELAEEIQKNAKKNRELDPDMVKNLPDDKKQAFLESFRKDMDEFIAHSDQLVAAIQASNWAEAQKAMESMGKMKKPSHQAYREKKK